MQCREFEFEDGSSVRFWTIERRELEYKVTYGKKGKIPQSQVKSFTSEELADRAAQKAIVEKLRKGYVEVTIPIVQPHCPGRHEWPSPYSLPVRPGDEEPFRRDRASKILSALSSKTTSPSFHLEIEQWKKLLELRAGMGRSEALVWLAVLFAYGTQAFSEAARVESFLEYYNEANMEAVLVKPSTRGTPAVIPLLYLASPDTLSSYLLHEFESANSDFRSKLSLNAYYLGLSSFGLTSIGDTSQIAHAAQQWLDDPDLHLEDVRVLRLKLAVAALTGHDERVYNSTLWFFV